jgi:uncharacterized protein DUF6084
MPNLDFQVEGVESVPFAATPTLAFKLRVTNPVPAEIIHTVALRAQIQIEVTRRRYSDTDKQKLVDLFGDPSRWGQTLRAMLWTHASAVISSFQNSTVIDLQVPCTFDFNVAATKYFHGVEDGEIPLNFLFSGTVFYHAGEEGMQVSPIPWNKESRFRLPVEVWRTMMDQYYPNTAWLALRRDIFDRLHDYKMQNGIPSWEEALQRLLAEKQQEAVAG